MLSHYRRNIFDIFTIIFEAAAKKAILEDLDQTLYKKIWFRIWQTFVVLFSSHKVVSGAFRLEKFVLNQIILDKVITVQLQHISDIF